MMKSSIFWGRGLFFLLTAGQPDTRKSSYLATGLLYALLTLCELG